MLYLAQVSLAGAFSCLEGPGHTVLWCSSVYLPQCHILRKFAAVERLICVSFPVAVRNGLRATG